MAILTTQELTKRFGGITAVDHVNLEIKEGSLTSIIGPNGAGKTTFFNLVTGLLKPDGGKIFFRGEEITDLPAHRIVKKGISRSFQIINLFDELTVFDNVWIGVQAQEGHGWELFSRSENFAEVKRKTSEIIANLGLSGKEDIPAKYLSHGDRRILEMAISLTSNPQLLLLDEPMSGLASEERRRMSDFIKKLSKDLTIIVVEHDMDVVLSISNCIIVMYRGKILAEGSPEEVRRNEQVQDAYLGGLR